MTLAIRVPSSKSVTQRALVLASLSRRHCRILQPLDCDDSRAMVAGLRQLGVAIEQQPEGWRVRGPQQLVGPRQAIFVGNAGTAARFLTGLSPLVAGPFLVDGDEAMRRRPMPGLLEALAALGVRVETPNRPGCPPVRLEAKGNLATGTLAQAPEGIREVLLHAKGSSQEISALLLLGAGLPGGLRITVEGPIPSRPYLAVTEAVLSDFGVPVRRTGDNRWLVGGVPFGIDEYTVEGDWSSASYPLAAAWLTGRPVRIANLDEGSPQGDRRFPDLLAQLSHPGQRLLELGDQPDLVPTLVACALFAQGSTAITRVAHLRIKESDRIAGLVFELRKLGADLTELEDGILVRPAPLSGPALLDPARDHRLAMAFGLVSLRVEEVEILDRGCVSKSYPDFWSMLEGFR
ncbi:MAG: 3-phosphoshikimate 1-carboxyvinyltransferase [Bradymonadales bacterium]|nr:3-phosphoshikimate 1-carboxyvinyltransferase [Bradymonadales bacterium]